LANIGFILDILYADMVKQNCFAGSRDNTDIPTKLAPRKNIICTMNVVTDGQTNVKL